MIQNPCGSSMGSAVGVAAGFAPIALGTEIDGSITQPAGRASLYGLKATVGAISTNGTSPYSPFSDSIGSFAKSADDMALLMGALMNKDFTPNLTKLGKDNASCLSIPKSGLSRQSQLILILNFLKTQ